MKVIRVKDASSVEPQEIPNVGIFPQQLAESGKTEAEWRAVIKKDRLPLEITEVKSGDVPAKYEGTAVEAVAEGGES